MVWLSSLAAGYEWQKAVRKTAGLLRVLETRVSCFLPRSGSRGLVGNDNFYSQDERRFHRLFYTMPASNNHANCFLATKTPPSVVGVLGWHRVYLANKYQCSRLSKHLLVPPWCRTMSDELRSRVKQIRELVRARDVLRLSTLGLRVSHWHLHSWPHIEAKLNIELHLKVENLHCN